MKRHKHSFANYPLSFRGCVVSPTKICLQFNEPTIKLRVDASTRDELKKGTDTIKYLAVPETGIDIACTAVGCQMPVVEQYQLELLEAYRKYYRLHAETYKQTYNKDFKDFLLKLQEMVNSLVATSRVIESTDKYTDIDCTD